MPELPDLHYIVTHLAGRVENRRVDEVVVKEPIVIRFLLPGPGGFTAALRGRQIESLARHGPFLVFGLSDHAELIVHCMLAGRLQIAAAREKSVPHLCFSLRLDNGEWLRYGDDKRMGKVYLTAAGSHESIPGYSEQGVDVLSRSFTFEMFEKLIAGRRHQARVFLMDQSALSAIGNAYADEILFAAGVHPKTACSSLSAERRRGLYDAIRSVLAWGIAEVEKAGMPIEVKVRDHMRVRGRKDQPCPRCGAKIRRVGVLGYDSFYCPSCQPATRTQPIPW